MKDIFIGGAAVFAVFCVLLGLYVPDTTKIPMVREFSDDPCGHHPDRKTVGMKLRTYSDGQQKMEFICNDGNSYIEKVIGELEP